MGTERKACRNDRRDNTIQCIVPPTQPSTLKLEGLQVSDDVALFFLAQELFVRRHSIAALVDDRLDVRIGRLLAVVELVPLVIDPSGRAHFLFVRIGVVASAALLESLFPFRRVAGLRPCYLPAP